MNNTTDMTRGIPLALIVFYSWNIATAIMLVTGINCGWRKKICNMIKINFAGISIDINAEHGCMMNFCKKTHLIVELIMP